LPESIRCRADVDALLAAATNYEDRLPRDPLRKALDLERVRALLASVGDPQEGPRTVHVAGSKGKGTTARMIGAGLRHAGLGPVGLFTSPHLEDLAERIEVEGRPASGEALAEAAQGILAHVRATRGTPEAPTFFELFTAIAWQIFRAAGCPVVVLETGLGGRLDATNVCTPAVTVITSIELEHTRLLGNTVAAISAEKAGILKAGVPAISTASGAAAPVVAAHAAAVGAPLLAAGDAFQVLTAEAAPGPRLDLTLQTPWGYIEQAALPLAGVHHADNAAAAWLALRALGVDGDIAWRGIAEAPLPGLLEALADDPLVLIDGAHTRRSAAATRAAVEACWPGREVVLVLALLEEKDVEAVVTELGRTVRAVIVTQVDSPRAFPPATLAKRARDLLGVPVVVEVRPAAALERARALAVGDALVLCAGSIYLAGEIRTLVSRGSRTSGTDGLPA